MATKEESRATLWDIHRIQQVYLIYAIAMDSHQRDLMDQCFLAGAEVCLGWLGKEVAGSSGAVVDLKRWRHMYGETGQSLDAIQHYIYQPPEKIRKLYSDIPARVPGHGDEHANPA